MARKAVEAVLLSLGIHGDDRREMRADFQHLRKWRKSVEQAQSLTFKVVVTSLATGFLAAECGLQIILSNTRHKPYDPGRPNLAAATLEAANGMTSHSKTCYADIVKCLARALAPRRPV